MTGRDLSPFSGMRVLVTGGLGFMGFNLVRALQEADVRLRVLSRSWPPLPLPGSSEPPLGTVTFFHGDIRDPAVVEEAVSGCDLIWRASRDRRPATSRRSRTSTSTAAAC